MVFSRGVTALAIIMMLMMTGCKKDSSPVDPVDTPKTTSPAPPQNLAVTDLSSTTITIKWRKNTEADFLRYMVYRGTSPAPTTKVDSTSGGMSDTSKTFTGLPGGTRFYFRVTAVDSAGNESGYSNEVNAALAKSAKRGIAYNITSSADLDALSSGLSWWYSWGKTPSSSLSANYKDTYGMDFIPMLWGGNTSSSDIAAVESFLQLHPEVKYLLVMNEPNLTDQANRTPAQAATDWLKYEQVVSDMSSYGQTIYIVGPAMSWGTMTGYSDPVIWLDAFYTAYKTANGGKDPKIDFLAFHWYDYGLATQLDRLQKYGKKIWITEMANWNSQINSYDKQKVQMQSMVSVCETRADVFRYAWFIGRGSGTDNHYTYLFTSADGVLSDLGKYYISLPFSQ